MNNKYLKTAIVLARLMQLGYGALIVLFAYLLLIPALGGAIPPELQDAGNKFFYVEFSNAREIFSNTFNMVFYSLRAILLIVLFILSLESLIRIIRSVKTINAFKQETIRQFSRIGFLMLICFIITLFDMSTEGNGYTITLSLEIQYLLFAFLSWILAEVFKEGNRLWEESQLTI
ncbi:DUF2975 domain-containing protein [Robertkochia aurantiaca]|uniref:DUF2975 domain-containing protein n=1 Tax=Robertkochia aurantiaca TaxID=2873700 RepID=UPI001CC95B91|nr:DUF2975 domain-containing protein [Robertkochia sp. 3YJGBD-33]